MNDEIFNTLVNAASEKDPNLFLETFNEIMAKNVSTAIDQYLLISEDKSASEFVADTDDDQPLDVGSFINEMTGHSAEEMMGTLQAKTATTVAPVPEPFSSDALGKQDKVGESDPKKKPKSIKSMRNNNNSIKAHSSDAVGAPNKDIDGMPKDEFFVPYGS